MLSLPASRDNANGQTFILTVTIRKHWLAAVSIGGSLMGVVGMLIFIPLVSVIYTIFRGDVYRRLEERGIKAEDLEEKETEIKGIANDEGKEKSK